MLKLAIMVCENDCLEYMYVLFCFYLVLYGLVILMAFLINPFLFFYYEEKEDEEEKLSKVCMKKY